MGRQRVGKVDRLYFYPAVYGLHGEALAAVDKSMDNLKKGIASEPIDLSEFAD